MTQYGDLLRLGYFQDKPEEERAKILADYEKKQAAAAKPASKKS